MTLRVAFQSVEQDNEFGAVRRMIDPIEIWRVPTLAPIRNRITSRQPACVNGLQMPAGQPPRRTIRCGRRRRFTVFWIHRIERFELLFWLHIVRWHEPMTECVFRNRSRFEKLQEIIGPTRFGTDSGKLETAKGLSLHHRAGNTPVDVKIADTKFLARFFDMRW